MIVEECLQMQLDGLQRGQGGAKELNTSCYAVTHAAKPAGCMGESYPGRTEGGKEEGGREDSGMNNEESKVRKNPPLVVAKVDA